VRRAGRSNRSKAILAALAIGAATAAVAVTAPAATAADPVNCPTASVNAEGQSLRYSASSNRIPSQVLDSSTATFQPREKRYVFLQLSDPTPETTTGYKVEFWLDNCDLNPRTERVYHVAPGLPNGGWDFFGGNDRKATAFPLSSLEPGLHTIVARRTQETPVDTADPKFSVVSWGTFCLGSC
jgi:hypothetical protein